MNVLFVHEVDWLKKVVFDFHILAEGLSTLGHRVYVIDYPDTWKRENLFDLGNLKTREIQASPRVFDNASITLRRPGVIKIPGLSRISAAITGYFTIRKTIKEKNIDAVILYSVPTTGLQTLWAARKFGIPVVFRSIDILSVLVRYRWLRPITRFLEKKVYAGVNMVIPNTPRYFNYITSLGVPESRVKLLHFPLDTRLFQPGVNSGEVRRKWKYTGNEKIIVFIGTLFDFSGLDVFLHSMPEIIKAVPEARLLIVGDGPQRPVLEQTIRKLNLGDKVTITGFQPYRSMPEYINLATVCINTFTVSETTMDVFPAKIIQYIACGKATVATALRGITTLLPGESHGVVYANSASDMAREVTSLLKSAENRQKLESAGLNYIKQTHSYDKIVSQLEGILEKTIQEKRTL